ncbi:RHS repeat-associated core domain-containing protein [Pseudomonas amygdali]|uniref:RHS repeat-associated core domain-containing protein n=1 Tax=Pseudomonas amygdali TaxID=47877 RepID=UPI001C57F7B7|nr:RHS repeat-associated core domain-containing protein [Pseudomonas amygdali]QXW46940.1 toxin [Pseudomonas amygdali]
MTASLHQYTPSLAVIDPRSLAVRNIAYYRRDAKEVIVARVQRHVFNTYGNLSQQWDPRLLDSGEIEIQPTQTARYSLSGQALQTESVDAGWRVACHDAAGVLYESWDGRGTCLRYAYDELMRPVSVFEQVSWDAPLLCVERFTYAGSGEEDAHNNRCGQLIRHDDQAGSLSREHFGVLAQPLTEVRRFCKSLAAPIWPESADDLEIDTYATCWRHDALGAVIEQKDALDHVQRFEVNVTGGARASWLDGTVLLKRATYNAFGDVEIEQAGNDVITTAYYSPVSGVLCSLKAESPSGKMLQDLHYQYDPVGNIEQVEDLAQPVQWDTQQRIQAVSTYTYDTLYQLISATGRESATYTIGPDLPGLKVFGAADDSRWRNYRQTYSYDSGGNLTRLRHNAGVRNTYTREMVVDPRSNRSVYKDGSPIDFAKAFDANGNQQNLSPGQVMQWDTRNHLRNVTQVQRDAPDGQDDDVETYVYDGGGQRVRKVRRAKTLGTEQVSEVRYLPGLEIRTRTSGETLHAVIAQAGRNSVHWLHWENGLRKGIDNDQVRYSLSDSVGSHTLELNQQAELISQESYYPYGGTAWWAAKNAIEATYKTVRYSGKERDATGLYYYGFRYYAPWLQRWISPDPAGDADGLNRYRMVRNNPVTYHDTDGLIATRTHFDEKDIEGFSSVFQSIKEGLSAAGLSAEETVFVMVGRSPQALGEYISASGFDTALLQVSGLGNMKKMPEISELGEVERTNRNNYLDGSLGEAFSQHKNAVLLDYSVTGSSIMETHKMLTQHFGSERTTIKMATISRFLNDDDLSASEAASFHHPDNLLYDTPRGKARLDYKNRGVMRLIKILHNEIDKGLSYTEKFHFTNIDSGETAGILEDKKSRLNGMMTSAIHQHKAISYTDIKDRNRRRFTPMVKNMHPHYSSPDDYIASYNFKRTYTGSFLHGIKKAVTGYRS